MTDAEITFTLSKIPDLLIEERGDSTLYITVPVRSQQKQFIICGIVAIVAGLAMIALQLSGVMLLPDVPPFGGGRAILLMLSCLTCATGFTALLLSANFSNPKPGFIEVSPAFLKSLACVSGDSIRSSFSLENVIFFEAATGYLDVLTKKGNTRIMSGFKSDECLAVGLRVGKIFRNGDELATKKNTIYGFGGTRVITHHIFGIPRQSE